MKYFGRKIELTLKALDNTSKTFTSEDNFSIEFNVEFGARAIATAKIVNVLLATAEMCKAKGKKFPSMEISAGYGDSLSLLASGSIISSQVTKSGPDRILEIKMGASLQTLTTTFVIKTFQKQKASLILKSIFFDSQISFYKINLNDDPLLDNISFTGNLQQALISICKRIGAIYFFKFGKIVIESKSFSKIPKDIVRLDRESGLIGSPEINGVTLKAKSLLNTKLVTGEVVEIAFLDNLTNKEIVGMYKIGKGKHAGGNKIESFYTEFECKKI